jgi:Family of unknown function (DUF5989)
VLRRIGDSRKGARHVLSQLEEDVKVNVSVSQLTVTREGTMGEFLLELWSFMRERKKFWLLPIIICLVMLGSLVVFTSGSAVAPFIYTLF